MVWDKPKPRKTLNRYDWMVLGRDDVIETGKLPCVRLDIPLPHMSKNIYTLATEVGRLAAQLQLAAEHGDIGEARMAVWEARSLVKVKNQELFVLKREWEREMRHEKDDAAARQELSGIAG